MYLLSAHQNPVGLDIHKNNPNLDHFISHNYYYTDTYYLAVPLRTANLEDKSLYKAFLQTLLSATRMGTNCCIPVPSFRRFSDFFTWAIHGLFFVYFRLSKHYNFYNKYMDLNPRPSRVSSYNH